MNRTAPKGANAKPGAHTPRPPSSARAKKPPGSSLKPPASAGPKPEGPVLSNIVSEDGTPLQYPIIQERGFYSDVLDSENEARLLNKQNEQLFGGLTHGARRLQPLQSEVGTEKHTPLASSFKPVSNITQKLAETRPKRTTQVFRDSDFTETSYKPKVQVPFYVLPGQCPRKVEIERKKRKYNSSSLPDLLMELGIDSKKLMPKRVNPNEFSRGMQSDPENPFPVFLPLHIFDNTEYDSRTPVEWVETGFDPSNGSHKPVPGFCLLPKKDEVPKLDPKDPTIDYDWFHVGVFAFDESQGVFLVQKVNSRGRFANDNGQPLSDLSSVTTTSAQLTASQYWVPRIQLMFESEDPEMFARRVKEAFDERHMTEAHLRYHLYLDCMPMDGVTDLDDESFKRMCKYALDTPCFAKQSTLENNPELQSVLPSLRHEVNIDFTRTLNRLIFDKIVQKNAATYPYIKLPKDEAKRLHTPRVKGRYPDVPEIDFPAKFDAFTFESILTRTEAIAAIMKVRAECNEVAAKSLFHIPILKQMKVEEFIQTQSQMTSTVSLFLQDQWKNSLTNEIRAALRDVGRGWFNLYETNWEVYQISKLKKFMEMVKFCMQDSLRFLVQDSLVAFVQMIVDSSYSTFELRQDYVWDSPLHQSPFRPKKNPLFYVELVLDQEGSHFSVNLPYFESMLVNLFDTAIKNTQSVPQLEKFVMRDIFWADVALLESVGEHEKHIEQLREDMCTAVRQALIPLIAYARAHDQFLQLVNTDIHAFIKDYDSQEHSAMEVKAEVDRFLAEKERLEGLLPSNVVIGPFYVNVEPVRKNLSKKCRDLANAVLELLAKKLRTQADDSCEQFKLISRKLHERPNTIEELTEMREWMAATIPNEIKKHKETIDKAMDDYQLIEEFNYNLSQDDFNAKYTALFWPNKIEEQIALTEDNLQADEERFRTLQQKDQADFQERIDSLQITVAGFAGYTDRAKAVEIGNDVRRVHKNLLQAQQDAQLYNQRERLFEQPVTNYEVVNKLIRDFEPFRNLWMTASDWVKWYDSWMNDVLESVDAEQVESCVTNSFKNIHKAVKAFKDIPSVQSVAQDFKQQIEDFKPYIPLIQGLRNPGMRMRHWEKLSDDLGFKVIPKKTLTFSKCLEMNLQNHIEAIAKIAEVAGKEYAIEQALNKMEKDWAPIMFEVMPYKESGTYILKSNEECSQLLDDHIVMTQSMSFSPFKKPFEERINSWETKMRLTQDVLDEWLNCQRSWLYLEPIFSSDDINRQLPVEGKRYQTMERMWRKLMKEAKEKPHVIQLCPEPRKLENLRDCNKLLDQVQKGLSEYLETKRNSFPRFYFLSDDELLEILSQTKDPTAVQPHLRKCFENVAKLEFHDDLKISSMFSGEGENVPFCRHIYPEGNVEDWMLKIEDLMKDSVRDQVKQSLIDYPQKPRTEWVLSWPGQVVIAGAQTFWTEEVSQSIEEHDLPGRLQKLTDQIKDLVGLVRGKLTKIGRMILSALIVIEVHARDVCGTLVEESVQTTNDFEWISQLRYYWLLDTNPDGDLYTKAVNARFNYGYEYLGNTGRLVVTPLTDRCYLTLTGALNLQFGGAPAGPAGTGKTETTKDLAKAFAIQCVVFNCSDQLDYLAMGKFFKGLASSGAWACFDEFNRIDIEVLSVVAQQIATIQRAQQQKLDRFQFEGVELALKPSCAVFITMNPGYAGRTELPDNLKALFRPVAMMVPNYTMIAEISLYSFGFDNARGLANKITTTFKLSSEQLSSQDHYDFGMRAVKTVISAAGNLKREHQEMDEELICLRAIRDVNVPKFLVDDLKLFNGVVSDLFPDIKQESIDYGDLDGALRKTCLYKQDLKDVDAFVLKCIQLYETTVVRHGLMLVGPTCSGKTRCYNVLQAALTSLKGQPAIGGGQYEPVHTYVLNPKSITMGQLYGEFDLLTHEWTDGILSCLIRIGTTAQNDDKRWYMFDGPVDAVWIENMNTVLDDNKKLCLSSGEIIKLTEAMTMMFEVADLAVASPATVSRCGMVYLEPSILGLSPFVFCWLRRLPEMFFDHKPVLEQLFETYMEPAVEFIRSDCREIVTSVDGCLTFSMLKLLECFFTPFLPKEGEKPIPQEVIEQIPKLIEPWFMFALVWSIGATCDENSRAKFSNWLRKKMTENNAQLPFPGPGLVYDYVLDDGGLSQGGTAADEEGDEDTKTEVGWVNWMKGAENFVVPPGTSYSDIMIPTLDTIRSAYVIHMLITNKKPLLCVGPTGTGKTLTIADKLLKNMPPQIVTEFFTFSARTSANQTQDLIDSKLDKRRKGIFGPPLGKSSVFFIDDLNMPALETYGAQPPIELIRQFMDHSGWYDRKAIGSFRTLVDITFMCAMGPPGGGRNPITARLTRHFNYLSFTEMEDSSKMRIFSIILQSWLQNSVLGVDQIELLTAESINVYNTIVSQLLPTPAKSHYTFNLRDLSKVFQGMLMVDPAKIESKNQLFRLWYHENLRVFQDRLINSQDRTWFSNLLDQKLTGNFGCTLEEVLNQQPILYGDFMNPSSDVKLYSEIEDQEKLSAVLKEYLEDFNQINTARMNLVLFMDAMQHVCRISRVIRQPMGNSLLLGVGGSGRQSLSKLATHIAEYDLFQIELTKNYGNAEWREDLKSIMMKAGLENKATVFLFPDTQIKNESFLEDINNILNSGDVPNIYVNDEPDRINTAMRPIVLDMGQQPTKSNLFSAYTKRVRANLHLILCMSPIGEVFRARLRQFPALVNCCTIDWFSEWPEEALQSVAHSALSEMGDLESTDDEIEGMKQICVNIHQGVAVKSEEYLAELARHNYVTPTSYLELLSIFSKLAGIKKLELKTARDRTKTGLTKLLTTAEDVAKMEEELKEMQPLLEEAAKETETTMEKIATDSVLAEETKKVVEKEEAEATIKATKAQEIASDAQRDLDEALPALEAALSSLRSLNKNDVIEVRAMSRPPGGVRMVIEAVCIMKGIKPKKVAGDKPGQKVDDYWDPGKVMLQEPSKFLESLFNYDKDNIPDDTIKKIQPYMENEEFLPSAIAKVSKACTSLCQWVRAMHKYHFVAKNVAPKRAALAEAQNELAESQRILDAAKARLYEVQEGIATLQAKLNECVAKKEELERKTSECEQRLVRAGKLIGGLADEKDRWQSSVAMLEEKLKRFVGNVMIAAGYVAYLGTFTGKYRNDLLQMWTGQLKEFNVPHTDDLGLIETMGDPVKIRSWQIAGLPKDQLSTENGVIVQYSNRWSLFIDPQGQANKWIKTLEKDSGIDVFKLSDKDFLRSLENSIRFGKPCLMENIREELDPALEPILLKQTFKQQGSLVIRLGDAVIPYHEDFRFYITTKLPNPHYTPEISTKVTLVNFTLSPSGLEDQLLARVVAEERPDLEDAKNQLIVSNAKMKAELKEIEDKILERLSSSEGNPVDDVDLIKTLEASKVKSKEIKDKVVVAEKTEKDIDETRSLYIPVSVRTQILFFCTTDLANVDPMYQYSLEWFINLFLNGIANAERAETVGHRIENINNYFTYNLYINVCRSLFEKHKLMFAFLLAIRIMMNDGLIDPEEWRYFISGGTKRGEEVPNPAPDWLSDRAWGDCITLSALPAFAELTKEFASLVEGYKAIFDSNEPHRVPLPGKWNEELSMFQKIIVLKCLRADMVTNAMQDFVAANLGQKFIEPQTTDLSLVYKDSSPTTPLIFVLSTGTDPAADLNKFAEEMRMAKKFNSISLGQGQGPVAESLARSAIERGRWVFFQNCHLAPSWMPSLERMIEQIDPDKVHRDFRLWLTSMPSPKFPVAVLQNSSKMTVEPPKGIKANLLKSYLSVNDELLNSTEEKTHDFKSLVFSLCLFHGALLERRKFGPLGFNIPYEFTDGDLRICLSQLKMFLLEYPIIPYKVLSYTAGHINYGGRVTDDWDRRCMMNILADYYNERVLQENHKFSESGVYYQINTENDHTGYLSYVKSLPINDTPEIFGLHDNANITFAQNETFNVLAAIVKLQPKTRSGGGQSPEEIIENTAISILERVPEPMDAGKVLEKYPVLYEESMNTVLVQEIIRYNRLLSTIHSSLKSLRKALKGLVVMSDQLEKLSNSLFINNVPAMWAGKAYPSLKPLAAWVSDLIQRVDFLQNWVENGIPPSFWISGFFFPQAFLTGTLQNFARKYHISIDVISFGFEVVKTRKDDIKERPESGCFIYGLFLEGCRWGYTAHQLIESRPKELYTEMPVIWLKPVQNRKVPTSGIYNCPVYKTLTRAGTLSTTGHSTNFVLPIEIPTDKTQNHWIKRGVALICALDY